MMTDALPPFEDASLKQAVRGAWGKVAAPASFATRLRGQLASAHPPDDAAGNLSAPGVAAPMAAAPGIAEQAIGATATAGPIARPATMGPGSFMSIGPGATGAPMRMFSPLAAAAAILLAVGAVFWAVSSNASTTAFPAEWSRALVERHDVCSSLADHHFVVGVAPDDIAGARNRLADQLGFAVLSMAADDGWHFRGAGPCPLPQTVTAHFLYGRGDTTLSVFSVSAPGLASASGDLSSEVAGHELAGFVRGGTLYCVVEYDPTETVSAASAGALLDQLKDQFPHPSSNGSGAAVAQANVRGAHTTAIDLFAPGDADGIASAAAH